MKLLNILNQNKITKKNNNKNLKPIIITISIFFVIIFLSIGWYLYEININKLELKQSIVIIEYGELYKPSLSDVVKTNKYTNIKNNNTDIFIKNIVKDLENNCISVGNYDVVVRHKIEYTLFNKEVYTHFINKTYTLKVVDTTSPKWIEVPKELECIKDCKIDFTDKFKATDLSKVIIEFDDKKVDYTKVGEYEAVAYATDESGNKISQDVKVRIKSPTIELSENSVSLIVNNKAKIEAKVIGKDTNVVWNSTDESIAKVENGIVTGIKEGNVIIKATANGVEATCEVTVIQNETTTQEGDLIIQDTNEQSNSGFSNSTNRTNEDNTIIFEPNETTTQESEPIIQDTNEQSNSGFSNSTNQSNEDNAIIPEQSETTIPNIPYWCDEGGSHHVIDEGIGWYKTYDEAEQAAFEYGKKTGKNHYEIQQCDCGLYTAYVR